MEPAQPVFFASAEEFRTWLARHHATARELSAGFYRREAGRGIGYPEALDEALCFGWIDGVRRRAGAETYTVRFTPRQPGSVWSAVNVRRADRLIASGRMQPAGLRAFGERTTTRAYSRERELARLDDNLEADLRAHPQAAAFFDAQPPGYRKMALHWVTSAKQEATRTRRLARLIEVSAAGARLDPLKPNG